MWFPTNADLASHPRQQVGSHHATGEELSATLRDAPSQVAWRHRAVYSTLRTIVCRPEAGQDPAGQGFLGINLGTTRLQRGSRAQGFKGTL
jgi:hypothetical protein